MNIRLLALACCLATLITLPAPHVAAQQLPPEHLPDAFYPPVASHTHSLNNAEPDTLHAPSAFMAGRVAVQLVFVQSDGSSEPSSETWTANQIRTITNNIAAGLHWWTTQLPQAKLSFTLSSQTVASAYEPITHTLGEERLWVGDVLHHMGYDGTDHFEQAYAADAALRHAHSSDWATTIFIANSANDPDGRFSDNLFAYSYVGGPFMVLTSDVGPYTASQMQVVVAHELGHIFGALDQYANANVPCEEKSGYLAIANSNSQYKNCGTHEPSIMLDALDGYHNHHIDMSALGQIGYRDSDGDGIPDPLDTVPNLQLSFAQATTERPVLRGSITDQPQASPRQTPATINQIVATQYRVDSGPWMVLPTTDTSIPSANQQISTTLPLYDGSHMVEVQATNSVGNTAASQPQRFTVTGMGADPGYSFAAPDVSNTATIAVALHAPSATQVQISDDMRFADAEWQPVEPTVPWQLHGEGRRGVYARFQSADGILSPIYSTTILLDTTPPVGTAALHAGEPSTLQLDASDDESGVAAMKLTFADSSSGGWQPYKPTVLVPGGTQVIHAQFKDYAGNISQPVVAHNTSAIYLPLALK